MPKKNYSPEEIITKLREVEIYCKQGKQLQEAIRQIGVSSATYFKWRTKYGAMNKDEARRLKDLEKENTELKKLVANLSLDNAILKDFVGKL